MKAIQAFLKATLVGGILFLIPLALVGLVLVQVLGLTRKVTDPLVARFPQHEALGLATAIVVMVAVSVLCGLVAQTSAGKRISRWIEEKLLGGLPQYRMVKSMAEGLLTIEHADNVEVVLAQIEEAWQLAFVFERLDNGWLAVLLPQAPTPMSGTVMFLPQERVRHVDLSTIQAMQLVKRLGVGSAQALASVDLRLPAPAPSRDQRSGFGHGRR
jgi:uncharacterized membrane protein